ncbi:MAG: DUF4340 domain-containing protein [Clostridia bacterium]|nr:DUF4340 domain-containing protein [Clostridia bacterium]
MNKYIKNILIGIVLLGLLICIFLAVKGCENNGDEQSEIPNDTMIDLSGYGAEDIIEINYTNQYGSFAFTSEGGTWKYKDDPALPLDQTAFANIITTVSTISAMRDITDEVSDNANYGLDEPKITLEVTYSDSKKQSYIVGDYNTNISGSYLKTGDRMYVSATSIGTVLDVALFEHIKTSDIAVLSADTVTAVVINGVEYSEEQFLESFMEKYSLVYTVDVEDYKNEEKYGFDSSENTVTVKYSVKSSSVLDDGSVVESVNDHEYTLRFVICDDIQYLMLPDDVVIYTANGLDSLLNIE